MTDYEKGSPAWDVSQILTRHITQGQHTCAKVLELRLTANHGMATAERLEQAHNTACTCGAGPSDSEHTTEAKEANPWHKQQRLQTG